MAVRRRLSIYGNWSAYDELSDGVPLTEELAMRQFDEMVRLKRQGVRIDAYLMDAFWYAENGGYRSWRKPNWPDGPERWLDACAEQNVIPGLWFTANTLCHLKPTAAWMDSADANHWGLCCFHGEFLDDYLDVLDYWYASGIRIFKLDFADFSAAPPEVKAKMPLEEIRSRNVEALRNGLIGFRRSHPDAIFMGFNGFESRDYMDRTDRPLEPVIDLAWLDVFDSIYSGDPRPADVPAVPFWRSVDIYGDHTTRVLEHSGVPLPRIDNCGFMAGPTGTCYWRGKAMWKGMLFLTLARGGDLTVLYGDLSLFDDEDARWMASAQALFQSAFANGEASAFGGVPGRAEPYGWVVGSSVCVAMNPTPSTANVDLPRGEWKLAFADAGFVPSLDSGASRCELGPFQMALFTLGDQCLGVQEDCKCRTADLAQTREIQSTTRSLEVETAPGELRVFVRQLDSSGALVRTFAGSESSAKALSIRAAQGEQQTPVAMQNDRIVWSGMSWASADVVANGPGPVRLRIDTTDPAVNRLEVEVWRLKT